MSPPWGSPLVHALVALRMPFMVVRLTMTQEFRGHDGDLAAVEPASDHGILLGMHVTTVLADLHRREDVPTERADDLRLLGPMRHAARCSPSARDKRSLLLSVFCLQVVLLGLVLRVV